ncbi:MAG: LysM peptidoglycan-binding domain-containing protein, partial [Bacteroidetes bacterium]|nr:LysM peptidoglycan-binding domain-containing protein [Bacteroidota bacterium]
AEEIVIKKQSSSKSVKKTSTYVVKRGDTLETIAERYNVSIAALKRWNDLKSSRIVIGQKLKIPS